MRPAQGRRLSELREQGDVLSLDPFIEQDASFWSSSASRSASVSGCNGSNGLWTAWTTLRCSPRCPRCPQPLRRLPHEGVGSFSIVTLAFKFRCKTSRVPIIKVSALGCTRILLGKKHVSNVAEILADPHVAQQLELAKDQAIHPDTYRNLLEHVHFNHQV